MKKFKHWLRECYLNCEIECFPEDGYELHKGYNWGTVVILDKEKYQKHLNRMFNRSAGIYGRTED